MYVCMCICVYLCTYTDLYLCVCLYEHTRTNVLIHTNARTKAHFMRCIMCLCVFNLSWDCRESTRTHMCIRHTDSSETKVRQSVLKRIEDVILNSS